MRVGLFPGSYKPPHKGHYQMVVDAIQRDKLDHIVILISRNPRYLLEEIQKPEAYDKEALEKAVRRKFTTKGLAVKWIRENRLGKFPAVTAPVAKKIWELYAEEIKKKNKKVTMEVRTGFLFSPILNANVYLKSHLKKNPDANYFLYKSEKNEGNLRFEMILSKHQDAKIKTATLPVKYRLHATEFRRAILDGRPIRRFLPKPRLEGPVKEILGKA